MEEKDNLHGKIPYETIKKIAIINATNPYVDITRYELKIGFPRITYQGFFPHPKEMILYACPARTFSDKEKVVGYKGKSAGVSVRVAKGVSLRTGGSGGQAIRNTERTFNTGDLIVTNERVLFVGKDDTFEFQANKISVIKLLDKSSFVIQSGRTSKNVALNEKLVAYAYGIINYVVEETTKGADIFSEITEENKNIPPDQIELCNRVREESLKIKIPKAKKANGCLWSFIITFFIILAIVIAVGNSKDDGSDKNLNTSASSYTTEELIYLPDHPHVFDKVVDVNTFYDAIKDDRIAVLSIKDHAQSQRELQDVFDDSVLIYFIQHPTNAEYIGAVQINLFDSDFTKEMDLDKSLSIIAKYLGKNFVKFYKLDKAYIHGNENVTIYTYACRLNEAGVDYRNNEMNQLPNYYNFKIFHYSENNQWKIETDYTAYGDKSIDWIEKYADNWDINIDNYFDAE